MTDQELLKTNIITSLGLQAASDDNKVALISEMAALVEKRLIARILETLSEKDRKKLDSLLGEKGNESDEVGEFLKSKIPNIDTLFQEEVVAVKREMMQEQEAFLNA